MLFFKKNSLSRTVAVGIIVTVASILLITCIISVALLIAPAIPYDYIGYIMLTADAVGIFIGAYTAAALSGSRGIVVGLLCAFGTFIILLIAGFAVKDGNVGMMTVIRAAVLILFGILGGIKGVNRKEKVHIR